MDEHKPYFAPQTDEQPAAGEVPEAPVWGEDAQDIAREAGLGSYGPDPGVEATREGMLLLQSVARMEREVQRLRMSNYALSVGLLIYAVVMSMR